MTLDSPQPVYKILKWACLLLVLGRGEAKAQEPAQVENKAQAVAEQPAEGGNKAGEGQAEEDRQRSETELKAIEVSVLLFILVLVSGVTLVVLVVLWGFRTRRILRSPLPSQAQQDELWYLRPPKQKVADKRDNRQSEDPPTDSGETKPS